MQTDSYVNRKLDLAEKIVCSTGTHIFLTGKAGTGKTTFLRKLRQTCYKRMVVVAPTGVAAINAEGVTIHSFFQLSFGPQLPQDALPYTDGSSKIAIQKLSRNKIKILRSLDLLVIDEISMVRADILDAVDEVLRRVRRSTKPFGGVQLLMIGDVHQLPPIAKQEEWELLAPYYDSVYFFSSHALSSTSYICIELDHIYRQSDQRFIDLLNSIRSHKLSAEGLQELNGRYKQGFNPDDSKGYITLTTHNYQADEINYNKLNAIKSKTLVFEAKIHGTFPESNYPTKKTLELKVGARVMFVKNDPSSDKQYYNGKIGVITGYDEEGNTLTVECDDATIYVSAVEWNNYEYNINPETNEIEENSIGSFSQIPLRLAWAVTIHKSQGLTFDKVIIDAGQAFAHGQVYVALSRCRTLDGIVLKTRIPLDSIICDNDVDRFDNTMPQHEADDQKLNALQRDFQYSMMKELFNFDLVEDDLHRLSKVISANYTLFGNGMEQEAISLRNAVTERMCRVSAKFDLQLQKLHYGSAVGCEQNAPLQERLRQANAYFLKEVKECREKLGGMDFDIDNKTVKKQVNDVLSQLKSNLLVKQKTLEDCSESFSIENYQKAKAFNTVEAEKSGGRESSGKIDMSRDSLMWKLREWRASRADMLDTTEAAIVPIKALAEIARLKPTTLDELKEIPKLGKKRIGLYGPEILKIVAAFTGAELPDDIDRQAGKLVADTYELTRQLIEEGLSLDEIAAERHLTESTIANHVARFIEQGIYTADRFVDDDTYRTVSDYIGKHKDLHLSDVKMGLGDSFSYGLIRIVFAQMKYDGLLDD